MEMATVHQIEQLRRTITRQVATYAAEHPDDFNAHMTSAAVSWLLTDRPNVTHQGLIVMLQEAEVAISNVADLHQDDENLTQAQENILNALSRASALADTTSTSRHHVVGPMDWVSHQQDFESWSEQMAR
jgi:hypothetical protein